MEKSNIKGIRLIVAGIAIFFVFFVIIRIFFNESKNFSPIFVSSKTLIFVLWTIIILFSIIFLFILIRNIIKLYYKKSEESGRGTRFRKKLVLFFVSFSIIPTLLLFFFASDLIDRGIEKWFSSDIDSIMNKIGSLNNSYYEKSKDDLQYFSNIIANEIKKLQMYTYENRIFLNNSMKKNMIKYKLDVVNIYKNHKEILSKFNPIIPLQEYKNLPLDIVYLGLGGSSFIKIDSLKIGELIRSGVSFNTKDGEKILVIIGKIYPDRYIKDLKNLSSMANKYIQTKSIKDPIKTTYFLLFIFITILIIFSASWLGFYLAKGITVPIDKLVAASSQISKGNLDIKIDYTTKDEFYTLINQFNKMVSDLKENREKLNKRTIELRQRKSITETILENITTGVIALNSKGEILEINPEAERMLALKSKFGVMKHYSEILSKPPYKDINSIIEEIFKTKFKIIEKEIDIKIKGKILNLAIKITQIRSPVDNKFSGILVVLTDLTKLIKAQRMIVWREVAKRIAHEIKNPLTPIQISSQRILKSIELPDEKFRKIVEDSLNIILPELDSIKNLAEEFSNYARLPEIKLTRGDINLTLEKLISVYSSIYDNVKFNVNLDVDIPILIMDTEKIKRIFVNIIDNAIESMNEKGVVEIFSKYIKESQFARIEIADNGPGISDEDKQKLFIPYFSTKSSGTGLGLAIAHNIIEEHNGIISIVDNSPKGARFIIEIPS